MPSRGAIGNEHHPVPDTIKDILLKSLSGKADSDRYQEGYQAGLVDGYAKAVSELREAIEELHGATFPPDDGKRQAAVAPTERPKQHSVTAGEKDRRVREYLAAHPHSRYRDLNKALGQYVATRVYKLRDQGEVEQTSDRRFRLITPPSEEPGAATKG
jgi:hypothetical protein